MLTCGDFKHSEQREAFPFLQFLAMTRTPDLRVAGADAW